MPTLHSCSEIGGHPENEDAFLAQPHPLDPSLWLCFLADGQGGQAGGGPAARRACATALTTALSHPAKKLLTRSTWLDILRTTDAAVQHDPAAGFTTFVGLCISPHQIIGVSSGDSAALLVHPDQTVELTAAQRKNPPVGSGAATPTTFTAALKPPWKILVMSDGVWKYAGWESITALAHQHHGQSLLTELQQAARLPTTGAYQDDFTLLLFESTNE